MATHPLDNPKCIRSIKNRGLAMLKYKPNKLIGSKGEYQKQCKLLQSAVRKVEQGKMKGLSIAFCKAIVELIETNRKLTEAIEKQLQ